MHLLKRICITLSVLFGVVFITTMVLVNPVPVVLEYDNFTVTDTTKINQRDAFLSTHTIHDFSYTITAYDTAWTYLFWWWSTSNEGQILSEMIAEDQTQSSDLYLNDSSLSGKILVKKLTRLDMFVDKKDVKTVQVLRKATQATNSWFSEQLAMRFWYTILVLLDKMRVIRQPMRQLF